jgi:hypothetical protein
MNREGTLHIVQVSKPSHLPTLDRYQVGFADYASPSGAIKMKEFVGDQALRDFFTSIGVQPNIAESALLGLRTEGSASVLNVALPEEMLINLGLADPKSQSAFSVRFTVFSEPNGPILAYTLAGPFMATTFASKAGVRYADALTLIRALDGVGLPGREIVNFSQVSGTYTVTPEQLSKLGLKPPAW